MLRLDTIAGVADEDVREEVTVSTDGQMQQAIFNMQGIASGHELAEERQNYTSSLASKARKTPRQRAVIGPPAPLIRAMETSTGMPARNLTNRRNSFSSPAQRAKG